MFEKSIKEERGSTAEKQEGSAVEDVAMESAPISREEMENMGARLDGYEESIKNGELIGNDPEVAAFLLEASNADGPGSDEIRKKLENVVSDAMAEVSDRLAKAEISLSGADLDKELDTLGKATIGVYGLPGADSAEQIARSIDKAHEKAILASMGIDSGNAEKPADASANEAMAEQQRYDELAGAAESAKSFDELLAAVDESAIDGMVPTFASGPVPIEKVRKQIEEVRDRKPGWEGWLSVGDLQSHIRRLSSEMAEAERPTEAPESRIGQEKLSDREEFESEIDDAGSFDDVIAAVKKHSSDGMFRSDFAGDLNAGRLVGAIASLRDKNGSGWQNVPNSISDSSLQRVLSRLSERRSAEERSGNESVNDSENPVEDKSRANQSESAFAFKANESGSGNEREDNVMDSGAKPDTEAFKSNPDEDDFSSEKKDTRPDASERPTFPDNESGIELPDSKKEFDEPFEEVTPEMGSEDVESRKKAEKMMNEADSFEDIIGAVKAYSKDGVYQHAFFGKPSLRYVIGQIRNAMSMKTESALSYVGSIPDPVLRKNVERLIANSSK